MSVYRQQAILPLPNDATNGSESKPEAFHQKSSAVALYPSSSRQNASAFNPKRVQDAKYSAASSLEVSEKQSKFIADTMRELREKELNDRATKRMKTDHMFLVDESANATVTDCKNLSSGIDIVDEMELHQSIAQMVATSGGLITVCEFLLLSLVLPLYLYSTFTISYIVALLHRE